jgi:hypothetical protein
MIENKIMIAIDSECIADGWMQWLSDDTLAEPQITVENMDRRDLFFTRTKIDGNVADNSATRWLKKSRFAHLLKELDGLEWCYDYDCCYSRGTVLLLRGEGDWEFKTAVIHTTGTIPENDLQEFFEFETECYAVLRGGEVTREKVQTTIDWGNEE